LKAFDTPQKLDTMWKSGDAEGPVRLHGGLSTGAKTSEGIERIWRSNSVSLPPQ
jgi:hypothetical protein